MENFKIKLEPTSRGFMRGDFIDRYGHAASIQESSLATESALWLGLNDEVRDHKGEYVGSRMHLTQGMVKALLPLLEHFAITGELPRMGR